MRARIALVAGVAVVALGGGLVTAPPSHATVAIQPAVDPSASTAVNCTATGGGDPTVGSPMTCLVTVTNPGGGTAPTGTVTLKSTDPDATIIGSPCRLNADPSDPAQASCGLTYTPGTAQPETVTATYVPDAGSGLTGSDAMQQITASPVAVATQISLVCSPNAVALGDPSNCVATVTAADGADPTGVVDFTSADSADPNASDGYMSSYECTLTGTDPDRCTQPPTFYAYGVGSGSSMITASYQGTIGYAATDPDHPATFQIQQTLRPTSTTVACDQMTLYVGQSTSCAITVADSDPDQSGAGYPPAGTLAVSGSGSGGATVSPDACLWPGAIEVRPARIAADDPDAGDPILATDDQDDDSALCAPYTVDTSAVGLYTVEGDYTPGTDEGIEGPAVTADPVPPLPVSDYDGEHAASSGTETLTINPYPTATAVSCAPSSVLVGSAAQCTATVTDTISGGPRPTGSVTLAAADGTTDGALSHTSCALPTSGADACSVTYTPSAVGAGSEAITGTYAPDTTDFTVSHGVGSVAVTAAVTTPAPPPTTTTTVTAPPTTTPTTTTTTTTTMHRTPTPHKVGREATVTTVNCAPQPTAVQLTTRCTATVANAHSHSAGRPTGRVTLSSAGGRGVQLSATCTLATHGAVSCAVPYSPTAAGARTVTAKYAGDASHAASAGHGPLAVLGPPHVVVVSHSETAPHDHVWVSLYCRGLTGQECAGTVQLVASSSQAGIAGGPSPLRSAAVPYAMAVGRSVRLRLTLPAATVARLAAGHDAIVNGIVLATKGLPRRQTFPLALSATIHGPRFTG